MAGESLFAALLRAEYIEESLLGKLDGAYFLHAFLAFLLIVQMLQFTFIVTCSAL